MNGILGGKILTGWACNALGIPTFRAHQTDYPEIEAEGQTPAAARGGLIELLVQAHDFASEAWRYQPLALALIDVRAFNGPFTAGEWTEPRRSRLPSMEADVGRRLPVRMP
jgi:hypothetical protein